MSCVAAGEEGKGNEEMNIVATYNKCLGIAFAKSD